MLSVVWLCRRCNRIQISEKRGGFFGRVTCKFCKASRDALNAIIKRFSTAEEAKIWMNKCKEEVSKHGRKNVATEVGTNIQKV